MRFRESDTRHLHELEVAREREGRLASAHHEGVELVAFGIAEIGGVEFFTALSGRALAFAAERQRELVDAIDLGFVFRPERRHHAVADRHRLAVIGKRDAESRAAARTAPGDEAVVCHEAAHAELAAKFVVEFSGLFQIVGTHRDVTDHDFLLETSRGCGVLQANANDASQPCGVNDAQGSACAAPLAFADTGASPITATTARTASFTPAPVAPEIKSGVFFAARFSRSFCAFNTSGVTASILLSATISIFSVRCPT